MKSLAVALLGALILFSCEDEPITQSISCGQSAEFSDQINETPTDSYTIQSAVLDDKCLTVEVAAGGCDGESWEAQMLISPLVAESYPPQAGIKLIFDDNEDCEAWVTRSFSFDLSALDSIADRVWVRLEGFDAVLNYPGLGAEDLIGEWGLFNFSGGFEGLNEDVDSGKVVLNFTESEVAVDVLTEGIFPFLSGTYEYQLSKRDEIDILLIDGIDMGFFQFDTKYSFSVDQRPVDGFKYTFIRDYVADPSDCGAFVLESASKYESSTSDSFEVLNATISGDCLVIDYAASGCDGSTWVVELVDAQQILESFPVQRKLRMLLDNDEECDAVITRSVQFDLSSIQLAEYNEILIGLEGLEGLVSYTY